MKLLRLCILVAIFSAPIPAFSQIPTIDAASIAQFVEQLKEAKKQLAQMEKEYEAITGNSNYGRMLENEEMFTYIPESGDWREISAYDISELAERYGLTSDDPARQAEYERELSNMVAAERSYQAQSQRLANIEALMDRANQVDTPREREDLANAISIEQAALQLESNRMAALERTVQRDSRLEEEAANNRMSKMFE